MGFLTGKTAIITGAGRAVLSDGSCGSIGYGIATAFAKEGANLVITGRNVKKLEEAKNELEAKYGIRVLPVQADVCAGTDNEATVQNVVNQAVDTFGGIQVLVNNAQASASGVPLAEHTTEPLCIFAGQQIIGGSLCDFELSVMGEVELITARLRRKCRDCPDRQKCQCHAECQQQADKSHFHINSPLIRLLRVDLVCADRGQKRFTNLYSTPPQQKSRILDKIGRMPKNGRDF